MLGATGAVGQRFIHLLRNHPEFQVHAVTASSASRGKAYADSCEWLMPEPLPEGVGTALLCAPEELDPARTPVVFSALPGGIAGPIESALAERGFKVFTNAADHRMAPNVPLLIPEINSAALASLDAGRGFIVANGNCSGIILTLALAPLHQQFGIEEVHVTTLQARSGAGHPSRVDLDTQDNVLPYIGGEEDKLETEPHKVLDSNFPIHATCTRVDVSDGHFESVHARLQRPVTQAEIEEAFSTFQGPPDLQGLPNAPRRPIHVTGDESRPQPKLDRDTEGGMAVAVGRIRVEGNHVRFIVLGHNTVRGAAGQSILNAEFCQARGLLA